MGRATAILLVALAGFQLAAAQSFSNTGGGAVAGQTGSSQGVGSSFSVSAASGVGDPLMVDFKGRAFEFFGKVGGFYNLISAAQHQFSTHMKPAVMFDHNGTYMDAFSFRYRDHSVEVTLLEEDQLSVVLDGKAITLLPNEVESEHILGLAEGELQLMYELHKPKYGVAVEVSTELLQILMWMTPAGTVDEGGVEQPAYLNFEVLLLAAPGPLDGVIGHTYKSTDEDADDHEFHHPASEFEMVSFADNGHEHNLFPTAAAQQESQPSSARKLLRAASSSSSEALPQGFPLKASGRGASRMALRKAKAGKNGAAVLTAGARMG